MKEFSGSCHCKVVSFKFFTKDILDGLYRCNCSLCLKKSIVMKPIKKDDFYLISGENDLNSYKWNKEIANHFFCNVCGVYTHHIRRRDPSQISVNIMLIDKKQNYLLLKASLLLSLIVFAGYLIFYLGLFELIIESDRSRISVLILAIYLLATVHWFMNVLSLDKEIASIDKPSRETLIGRFNIEMTRVNEKDYGSKLGLLEDELSNKNALGYLIVDILLKLGLTGTVIGFILMLLPIGEIKDFDPQILQKLLSTMSGGMAVALYTTLTGLISSMLLKFQYFLIDSSLSQTLNYLNSKYE